MKFTFAEKKMDSSEDLRAYATKKISKLEDDLALEQKKVAQYQEMEKNLQDTLAVAQKTAEDVVESAKERAAEMEHAAKQYWK